MNYNQYLDKAIEMIATLKKHEHVVYRIGTQPKKPFVVNDDGLNAITKAHPRTYIGALHYAD